MKFDDIAFLQQGLVLDILGEADLAIPDGCFDASFDPCEGSPASYRHLRSRGISWGCWEGHKAFWVPAGKILFLAGNSNNYGQIRHYRDMIMRGPIGFMAPRAVFRCITHEFIRETQERHREGTLRAIGDMDRPLSPDDEGRVLAELTDGHHRIFGALLAGHTMFPIRQDYRWTPSCCVDGEPFSLYPELEVQP